MSTRKYRLLSTKEVDVWVDKKKQTQMYAEKYPEHRPVKVINSFNRVLDGFDTFWSQVTKAAMTSNCKRVKIIVHTPGTFPGDG